MTTEILDLTDKKRRVEKNTTNIKKRMVLQQKKRIQETKEAWVIRKCHEVEDLDHDSKKYTKDNKISLQLTKQQIFSDKQRNVITAIEGKLSR